ncbi:unnamed protein product [Closterium sp. NIES-54]
MVHKYHKRGKSLTVLPGNIPAPPLPEGYKEEEGEEEEEEEAEEEDEAVLADEQHDSTPDTTFPLPEPFFPSAQANVFGAYHGEEIPRLTIVRERIVRTRLHHITEVTAGEEEEQEEEEVEVDYEWFRRQYWPHLDQRVLRHVVVDAAFVWREITLYIKGSLQAFQALQQGQRGSSSTGHVVVGKEEYVRSMVGSNERMSAMGERDRGAVYRLFQAYERRKRQRGEYDSADLVLHLHHEIRRMQQRQEPWWSIDHTLPAPPWAIPGSTTTTGLHYNPPASIPAVPWPASCSGPCALVFHCVSVDEVQDLTQAQLALLPLLCGNVASGFVLAGNTAQNIAHGVDFRLEDLARVVYSEFLHTGDELGRVGGGRSGHGGSKAGNERSTGREHAEAGSSSSISKVAGKAGMKALPTFQLCPLNLSSPLFPPTSSNAQDVILFNFFASPQSTTPWALLYTYMRNAGLPLAVLSRWTCATSSSPSINEGCLSRKGQQQQLLQFNELK